MQEPPHPATQDAVFELLGNPATYRLPATAQIARHQTHAAIVFLAGDRALKVKRAVRYPFLDFSSLDKRKAACEAELAINRKFAPQLYRRVVPVTRDGDGALALDGGGEPVEWAVEMVRFDEDGTLDRLAQRGELDEKLLGKLAVMVAAMHERAEPVEPTPWIAAIEQFIGNNTSIFRRHPELFEDAAIIGLERQSLAAFRQLRPLLIERGRQGLIRRGHGDLHLGNIAVLDGEPVAFDALEFDPIIASGDLLYDLAFLLMDLLEFHRAVAANQILNDYYAAARRDADYDGIAALPFFMSVRAAIRAMTTASRLDVTKEAIARSARRYFDLAVNLLAPAKPRVLAIGGLSGTGKTGLARLLAPSLAPAPGALMFRSDIERKALYGVGEHERLSPPAYPPKFRSGCIGSSSTKQRGWRVPGMQRSSMGSLHERRNAPRSRPPPRRPAWSFTDCFWWRIWQRACSESARARFGCRCRSGAQTGGIRDRPSHLESRRCRGLARANMRQCARRDCVIGQARAKLVKGLKPRHRAGARCADRRAPRWRG